MAKKMVDVTLDNIYCVSEGNDPGDDLEIFGQIFVAVEQVINGQRSVVEQQNLWNAQPYVSIARGNFISGTPTRSLVLKDNQFLHLNGDMKEEDDGFWDPNDTL